MNIDFVEEPENELLNRKNLFVNPDSELSRTLSRVQDMLDSKGYSIDRSSYKYVKGKLCKFQIELISNPDITILNKRINSLKKLNINITKMKWDWSPDRQLYFMKIGKIQDKDLHVVVCNFHTAPELEDEEKIKELRDRAVRNEPQESDIEDEQVSDEEPVEEEGEILIPVSNPLCNPTENISFGDDSSPISSPIQSPVLIPVLAPIKKKPVQSRSVLPIAPVQIPVQIRPSPVKSNPQIRPVIKAQQSQIPLATPPQISAVEQLAISMRNAQTQHNRAIGRSGGNNSTVRPVANSVVAPVFTPPTIRTPVRQTSFLAPPQPLRPPTNTPISSVTPVSSIPNSVIPRPNLLQRQRQQLQAMSSGNPITSFKIRD